MENYNYVNFKEERDLGDIITDTFKFIRLEWKSFFGYILKIAIVPILSAAAAILYNSYATSKMLSVINLDDPASFATSNPFGDSGDVIISSLLLVVFNLTAYVMISIGALYYIKAYIENNGVVDYNELKIKVSDTFWSFIGLGILIGLTTGIGFLLCVFPGIYFYVVFSLAFCVLVFQNKSAMDSYGESFGFIKGHWWETFGCVLVVGILVTILAYIFSVPAFIYQLIQGMSLLGSDDPIQVMSMFSDPIYLFLSLVSIAGKVLFYSITLIATVLIYFDINEQKNASGTIDQIDNLGR